MVAARSLAELPCARFGHAGFVIRFECLLVVLCLFLPCGNPLYLTAFCRNIVLNNPKKRNALSLSMLQALKEDLLHDIKSKELRVIVISGTAQKRRSG